MKYWSCCQRKTSEFQHFLDQEGCEIGKHKWVDDKGIIKFLNKYELVKKLSFVYFYWTHTEYTNLCLNTKYCTLNYFRKRNQLSL